MKTLIKDILIGERQRTDLGDLSDLATLGDPQIGQIVPIILRRLPSGSLELVEGRRRMAKASQLGWEEIDAVVKDEMTDMQKQLMELFADIGRKDRTWQERCLAIAKIHELKELSQEDGEAWTLQHMATFTGHGPSNIRYMLKVADTLRREPKVLAEASGYTDAIKLLMRRQQAQVQAALEKHRQAQVKEEFAPQAEGQVKAEDVAPAPPEDQSAERTIITLRGHNKPLRECQFPKETFSAALFFGEHELPKGFVDWFKDEALIISWAHELALPTLRKMPYPLVWNILNPITELAGVPFQLTYLLGHVYCKNPPHEFRHSLHSVVNLPYKIGLSYSLVEHCLSNTLEDALVLCVGASPDNVALCNMVPVFIEPDEKRYGDFVSDLTAFYESAIPGVEVRE